MNEAKKLDQFYTKPDIAKKYYNLLKKKYNLTNFVLLEPSAGTGSFSDNFSGDFLALDLSPKKDYIKECDFFEFNENDIENDKEIFTIGNPPFGRNSSLALKFINKASNFSSYIAFVLPKTFKKISMQNKIDLQLHLVFEEDLEKNSFIHEEEDYDVPCVFQIWEKRTTKREKIIEKKQTELFDFCDKKEADFAIRRVGGLSGKVIIDFEDYKEPSHYYIKSKIEKNLLIENLKDCYEEFKELSRNTAGNPSLSKGELIRTIEKKLI